MADKRISQLVERTDIANNDVVPIVASGATTTNKATISSIQEFMQENLDLGVTSVGVTISQTDGQPISVTGSPITTSGNITINLPRATDSIRGLLDSEDFINFSNKQPAGNYVTLDTDQTITGAKTFSQDIFVNGRRIGRGSGNITSNTVVGNSALRDNTTGSENSAFGGNSLRQITTGAANTAIGFGSMINSETGSGNTAIGNSTLSGNNGSNNIAVGNSAGRYIAGGTVVNETCLNSVYLGANTRPLLDGNTNEIVIGQNAIGQGSNTVTIGNSSTTLNKLFGRLIHGDAVNADESATLGQVSTSLGGYVTLGTAQTITGQKTFNSTIVGQNATLTSSGSGQTLLVTHSSGSGIALDISKGGNGEGLRVTKTSGSGNAVTISGGNFEAPTIVRTGGTSSQFLMADGSVNTSVLASGDYVTLATSQSITGIKTFTNSIILKNSPSLDGFILQSFSPNALEFGATISGTTYYSSIVFPAGAQSWNLPNASGTIALTSNLGAYLPLTGGTLTGALNGTSATFNSTAAFLTNSGASTSEKQIIIANTGGSMRAGVESSVGGAIQLGTLAYAAVFGNQSNAATQFTTNGTARLTILGDGKVGIGTASPTMTLSIRGDKQGDANEGQGQLLIDGNSAYNASNGSTLSASGAGSVIIFRGKFNTAGSFTGLAGISGSKENTTDGNYGGNLRFYTRTNGVDDQTERMRITSAGNVGIGTASPATFLHVAGTSTKSLTGLFHTCIQDFTTMGAGVGGGITFMGYKIAQSNQEAFAGIDGFKENGTSGDAAGAFRILTQQSSGAGLVERMRITSGGEVLINATAVSSQGERFAVTATNLAAMFKTTGGAANNWAANFWNNGTSGDNLFIEFGTETSYAGRGSVTYNRGAGITAFNTVSDYRLKNEVKDFNALEIVCNLKPKEFRIGDAENKSIGFIAHELQEFFPQAVNGEKDAIDENEKPIYQGVDYSQLTGLLTKAIQELKTEIDSLKNQIK
jgi:hypothetical protein